MLDRLLEKQKPDEAAILELIKAEEQKLMAGASSEIWDD